MNLGNHIIVDMSGVDKPKMNNIQASQDKREWWNQFIQQCFAESNVTCVNIGWHDFDDDGAFTAFYLLSESHLSIHTWPEHGYIALDVFTCGTSNTEALVDKVVAYFEPTDVKRQNLIRGI